MKQESKTVVRAYFAAFAAMAAVFALYLLSLSGVSGLTQGGDVRAFSGGWKTDAGQAADLEEITASSFGGTVTLGRHLPAQIADGDALCFQTQNANVTVTVGHREVYRFEAVENLSGKGYGVAFHFVGLTPADAGRLVTIRLEQVLDRHVSGRIWRTYLCASGDYVRMLIRERMIPCFLSALILFFGVVLLAVWFWVPDKSAMPYDVAALGAAALVLGLWSLNDTNIPRLLTGQLYVSRVMDRLLPLFTMYPFISFVNSVTRLKRPVYRRAAFWLSVFFLALVLGLRCGLGIDMVNLNPISLTCYSATVLLPVFILLDNARYCKKHGVRTGLTRVYIGLAILVACVLTDVAIYLAGVVLTGTYGVFSRFGFVFFLAMMLLQFLRWWAHEHAAVERSRFVNRALQYAVSANDPEVSIRALLEYLGAELHAKRTYIFEEQNNGTWHGTYEWYAEGMEPRRPELLDLPYEGLIDKLYEAFKREDRLIINDREACRGMNDILYEILSANHVERMVVGPLEANGELIGLFGVDDAPSERLAEIAEIIRLISYFFAQLVLRREEQKRLLRYSYCDSLTGARNRRAFGEVVDNTLPGAGACGYVMCDINGLKAMNDSQGHEAGDALILDVAQSLTEVFGSANVYRMGGDEFAAFGFEKDAAAFDADVARVKQTLEQKGRSASFGTVCCAAGVEDLTRAMAEADALMYREKELYYRNKGDRRRR